VERLGEIAHQTAKIDARLGHEVEDGLAAVEADIDADQLHVEAEAARPVREDATRVALLAAIVIGAREVASSPRGA
jgi:hypothetical protein